MSKIIDLFPLPLGVVECPLNIKEIVDFFNIAKMSSEQGSDYGLVSEDTYILDNPVCKPLADWILNSMQNYTEDILGWDENFKLSQTWLTYKLPGQKHEVHTHPNSMLAGVFYYEVYDNYPAITFHNPIVSFDSAVLDTTDGDFSVKINGQDFYWIDDKPIIEIADYIEEQLKKENIRKLLNYYKKPT